MTIRNAYKKTTNELREAGISSADIDAKILLKKVLNQKEVFLFSHPEYILTSRENRVLRSYINRRKKKEPIAYILKEKEFFGYNFKVNKNVLIPRPETEELVERALVFIASKPESRPFSIIDVGTGSGNIIVSLSRSMSHNKNVALYATDISLRALTLAKVNASLLNCKSINFFYSDLFSNSRLPKYFDLIIANLPYVPNEDHEKALKNMEEVVYEPPNAIYATNNGSQVIKNFLDQAKNRLSDGGMVLIELDPRNAKMLLKYAKIKFGYRFTIDLEKDLTGRFRFLTISFSTHFPT